MSSNGREFIKSLLTSLCQREAIYPSLVKRGKGRFFNNMKLYVQKDSGQAGMTNERKMKIQSKLNKYIGRRA